MLTGLLHQVTHIHVEHSILKKKVMTYVLSGRIKLDAWDYVVTVSLRK